MITADDFGAAAEVNEAVEQAHCEGVLTAASLMVGAPAAADAVARARRLPGLGVGLHLVLTDGTPVLPPERVPALVDGRGRFRDDLAGLGAGIFFSPGARAQAAAEISAQFEAFAASGLTLDHVNGHRHFHLHPTIAAMTRRIGPRFGMRAVRWPIEPPSVLARAEGAPAVTLQGLAASLAARLGRRVWRRAGVLIPDQVFGMAWSGAMSSGRLAALIEGAPAGLTEIYLHPATSGAFPGAAGGYAYAEELAALLSDAARAAVGASSVRLGRFADFSS
ncbi:MAG TPA: hopanoid biosynthesis-associated protein HpnK [Caulobacteraceae bacterium]|nr:hopanoid biosynthesis-associated protein HpnK [Caulobacteraceae bacterium]